MNKYRFIFCAIAVIAMFSLFTGCASKSYVEKEVAALDQEIQNLKTSVEENQTQITETQEDLDSVKQETEKIKVDTYKAAVLAKGKLLYTVTLSSDQTKFALGKAELSEQAKGIIDDLFNKLVRDNENVYIEIEGHTCNIGSADRNYELGMMRANAVKTYVVEHYNIPLHKISCISYGFDKPIADNNTKAGKEQNRRVVIKVLQ